MKKVKLTGYREIPHCIHHILGRLACPQCYDRLAWRKQFLVCDSCGTSYPITDGIVDLRPLTYKQKSELAHWSKHWANENQKSASQKFFSFYRKLVFSRTVRYFVNRYFPTTGVFIEAGSGTSETSMRVDKCEGTRTLVAVDIVLSVLKRCHPIMDVRVGGDIFRLPFQGNSVDGIWNVGVMEHFTRDQVDQIMREFHRVLRPGGPLILLWPAADSTPQRLLRITERVINLRRRQERFRFHPDEIYQLESTEEGRNILTNNEFRILHIDYGFRSLMAFKILVGTKH